MASLLQSERVLYLVRGEKEMRAPLSQLYFCRYCSELRSLECVSHEVTAARLRRARRMVGRGRDVSLSARVGWVVLPPLTRCLPRYWLAARLRGARSAACMERGDWRWMREGAVTCFGLVLWTCPSAEFGL